MPARGPAPTSEYIPWKSVRAWECPQLTACYSAVSTLESSLLISVSILRLLPPSIVHCIHHCDVGVNVLGHCQRLS